MSREIIEAYAHWQPTVHDSYRMGGLVKGRASARASERSERL